MINTLLKIKEHIPMSVRIPLFKVKLYFTDREKYEDLYYWNKEHKKRFGKNNKKVTFFVIWKISEAMGLLSCYLTYLAQLRAIEGKGYIPVIDMQTLYYPILHNTGDKDAGINAWEYYFKRLSEYSVDEVKKSRNVIIGPKKTIPSGMVFFDETVIDKELLSSWYDFDEQHFCLRDDIKARFEIKSKELLQGHRVLGVMIRETYMALARARDEKDDLYKTHPGIGGHPVQPTVKELGDMIEERLSRWDCEKVFLVCETSYVQSYMEKRFPDTILSTGRRRRQVTDITLEQMRSSVKSFYDNYSNVESNIDYLEEIFVLSRCNSMIAGKCSGSVVAGLWNRGKYEHIEIISKGLY